MSIRAVSSSVPPETTVCLTPPTLTTSMKSSPPPPTISTRVSASVLSMENVSLPVPSRIRTVSADENGRSVGITLRTMPSEDVPSMIVARSAGFSAAVTAERSTISVSLPAPAPTNVTGAVASLTVTVSWPSPTVTVVS